MEAAALCIVTATESAIKHISKIGISSYVSHLLNASATDAMTLGCALRQFTSIPRAELAGLTAYAAQHRLPVGAADVAAAAAPRERAAPGAADGAEDDEGGSEEAWPFELLRICSC